ncbi:MAG TPA: DEAD/DEAH box helicase [Anaerolineae bacterium]|nr:DEAD/DEAH box helicase [Anaerolineae bacterium]
MEKSGYWDNTVVDKPRVYFLGGTLVLEGVERTVRPPTPFRWINAKWRCPAVHYRTIRPWLKAQGIRNAIPRWRDLSLHLNDDRAPHPYQIEALDTWLASDRWGSVILPTGAGKTFVALHAITATSVSTLVVVPTLDLLHQWYAILENAFQLPIGVWYGQEKKLEPLTVTTYPSAYAQAETLGDQFKLIIFDEIHHLPAPSWHEIALMCAAPYRLGLTATYPERVKAEGGKMNQSSSFTQGVPPSALLEELVGPVLYEKRIDDLAGEQLAEYRTLRLRVDLTPAERAAYDTAFATYTGYVREARLRESHGHGWWYELTRRSAHDHQARRAKVAELKLKEIVHQAQGKLEVLDQLLRQHRDQQMLIFTAHNRFAYQIARRHLIPAITHQTVAAERKAILDGFRAGLYRAIVTSKVLNEGLDVPEAKIAVVLGGSASAREYIQRLGRVLRKQGNTEAILYEVIARKTVDEGIAQRRRPQ